MQAFGRHRRNKKFCLNEQVVGQESLPVGVCRRLPGDVTVMSSKPSAFSLANQQPATRADFHRILGSLEDPKIIDILKLNPTVEDLEQAAVCAAGDHDVLAKDGHQASNVAVRVAEIITADEEDDEPPPVPEV